MVQKIQVQTPDGVQEYLFIPDSSVYDQAVAAGEVKEGMDIVYRGFLVHVLPDMSMLILTQILAPQPQINWTFVGGMPQGI